METPLNITESMISTTPSDDGPEDDPRVLTPIAIVELFIMIIGVIGNTLLFILMRSKKMTKHSFSVYFSFSAVSNSIAIFWNCIQDLYEIGHDNGLEQNASRSYTFGCGLLEIFDGWPATTSAWLMVFLAVDRYISVSNTVASQVYCRRPVALGICICVTFCAFILELPWPLITPDKADNDPSDRPVRCGDEATDNLNGLDVAETVIQLFIPVTIVTILNSLILVTLNKKKAFRSEASLTDHGQLQNRVNRLNVSIFYLLLITALTWLPFAIVNVIEMSLFEFQDHADDDVRIHIDYAWHVTLVMWLFTFAQDFYVLMLMSPVYRTEIKRQCACLPCFRMVPHDRLEDGNQLPTNESDSSDKL